MNINRTLDYLLLEGLVEHCQKYNEDSFIVEKADRSPIPFLLEIVNANSVKLNFDDEIKLDELIIITTELINIDDEVIDTHFYTSEILPDKNSSSNDDKNTEFEFDIFDNTIEVEGVDENGKSPKFFIKGYRLEQYRDYPEINDRIQLEVDSDGKLIMELEYDFQQDMIYEIEANYNKKKILKKLIVGQPTIYYSSIYHISQASDEIGILIKTGKENEFDLKLLIWKYSKMAFTLAGIATTAIKIDYTKSIIQEYVTLKVLLSFIAKSIRDINFTPNKAEESLQKLQVRLGDFEHGPAMETLTTQLIKAHKELANKVNHIEQNLPEYFKHLQSTKNVQNKTYKGHKVNRTNKFGGKK